MCAQWGEQYAKVVEREIRGKPIARVVPVRKGSPENLLLEIGMVLKEAGVSKEEALRALQAAQKAVHG